MGYYMDQRDADFFIPADKLPAVVAAIQGLHGSETIRDSGGRHFSWVPQDFHTLTDPSAIFDAWRWTVGFSPAGDIDTISHDGEKLGDDNVLFDAIAPFVKAGSYIEMSGEDGERWRWLFDGKNMVEKTATVTWT